MLNNDKRLDALTLPIIELYQEIELDLLEAVASRFDTYDTVGGTLEYHMQKLEELGALNKDTLNIIAKHSKRSEKELKKMLEESKFANLDMDLLTKAYKASYLPINPILLFESETISKVLEKSFKESSQTFKLIQTKAIESAKQNYMNILNKAYVEVSSGIYDYNTSIKRALVQMSDAGISGATYKRGNKIVSYTIESAVRRDTLTAVYQLSNKVAFEGLKEIDADHVEISSHLGARVAEDKIGNHAGWQGKIYKIDGSDEYPNLVEETGYGNIRGLAGVNCRHRMYAFIPGISKPSAIQYDSEENKRVYEATQKQRAIERDIRKYKKRIRVAEASNDSKLFEESAQKLKEKQSYLLRFCKENGLHRDVNRELIKGEL